MEAILKALFGFDVESRNCASLLPRSRGKNSTPSIGDSHHVSGVHKCPYADSPMSAIVSMSCLRTSGVCVVNPREFLCRFLETLHDEAIDALRRRASEKHQCE